MPSDTIAWVCMCAAWASSLVSLERKGATGVWWSCSLDTLPPCAIWSRAISFIIIWQLTFPVPITREFSGCLTLFPHVCFHVENSNYFSEPILHREAREWRLWNISCCITSSPLFSRHPAAPPHVHFGSLCLFLKVFRVINGPLSYPAHIDM